MRDASVTEERRPRVGVGAVVRRGDELLLVRRRGFHSSGTWSTPGGYLDFGEDPARCAAREVEEETGVRVDVTRFVAVTNDVFPDDGKHHVSLWFECEYAGGDAAPLAQHELSEVGWFREDELPEPLFPPFRRLLDGNCYPPPRDRST